MDINQLHEKFGSGDLTFRTGKGGFTFIVIDNCCATAEICLHGAHITGFVPKGDEPVIWMSEKSWWETDKPIRGGVPVCWPWFGAPADEKLPAHGFARLSEWRVAETESHENGITRVKLVLAPEDVTAMPVPFPFELAMEFTIGRTLMMELTIKNLSSADQPVSTALHTYFKVKDSKQIRLSGLDGISYEDRVPGAKVFGRVQEGDIVIDSEVDRIYLDTTEAVQIHDPGFNRVILVEKSGSQSTVVWNPWIGKSQRLPDFGDDEYNTMVCVETVNASKDARVLASGETHVITQHISVKK